MEFIRLFRVLDTAAGVSLSRGIRTGAVFLGRKRPPKVPPKINYEPGIRHRAAALSDDSTLTVEIEDEADLEEDLDIMNVDRAYDINNLGRKREREKLGRILTTKKFFKNPQEPLTLTCNEKDCIRYLHKTDPLQWDVKTLSESFPATPRAIKKVLKLNYKFSAELKKKLDLKVQKNWELLAKGELEAAPEVLEHLKKFINRREVLLEQINNTDFYLPEIKEQVVWNNGEMSNILLHYEEAIKEFAERQKSGNVELLTDCSEKNESETGKKSSLDLVHEKIKQLKQNKNLQEQESFTLGGMIKAYSKPLTMEELKRNLLEKAEKEKALDLTERAIVESTVIIKSKQNSNSEHKSKSFLVGKKRESLKDCSSDKNFQGKVNLHVTKDQENSYAKKHDLERLTGEEEIEKFIAADSRTKFVHSNQLGKVLEEISNKGMIQASVAKSEEDRPGINVRLKKGTDFIDPVFPCEEHYFDNQVKEFENTSFWNKGRKNQEKILAENEKGCLGGPDTFARGNVYSSDIYPERIQIPKNKRGSGLTFRVKDCYYDDDGEFLYRVPGMVK